MQREQQAVMDYLQEEVRVLKEAFGEKQPRLNDAQRIRLAAKAKKVKFGRLKEVAGIVGRLRRLSCPLTGERPTMY
jgi:hypothetical protein